MNKQLDLKVALAQIEIEPGHPDVNAKRIVTEIETAKTQQVDVIVFPEMAVPGYLLGDEWENDKFVIDAVSYNQEILAATKGIVAVWGNVDIDTQAKNEDGRSRKYNAALVAANGEWASNGVFTGKTYKSLLPKYREFDDERHFCSMLKLAHEQNVKLEELLKPFVVEIRGQQYHIGVIMCEDMWSDDYADNPTQVLVANGADLIVNISCSPWTWRKNDKRHRVVKSLMQDHNVPFLYCNNVGTQNNGKNIFLFDGSSTIYGAKGKIIASAQPYKYYSLIANLNQDVQPDISTRDSSDLEELYDGLVYGISQFFNRLPSKKVVIGLSGGIDSAVVAALLAEAVGPENIYGVNMPTKFNSNLTKGAAAKLAENLGINYAIVPIQDSVNLTVDQINSTIFKNAAGHTTELTVSDFVTENVQARDRGSRVLSGIAAALGAVFTNNGNKTETAIGYATLYGDVNGALAPIADLYKHQIYALAEYINYFNGREMVPAEIIKIKPSAELSANQNVDLGLGDPIEYDYHDQLLRQFVELRQDPEDLLIAYANGSLALKLQLEPNRITQLFPDAASFIKDLEHKWRLYKLNFFKRIQAPPIIAVSKRAFGFDLRESQNGVYYTREYLKLKAKLLQ